MKKLKSIYREFAEVMYLVKKHGSDYKRFFLRDYSAIKRKLKQEGIIGIRISNFAEWKIWYNCCYFKGYYKRNGIRKQVFIKAMGPLLDDCFYNESMINQYIEEHSEMLSERTPKLILAQTIGSYYIIASEYVGFQPVVKNEKLMTDIRNTIMEYRNSAILHTDFGSSNMGEKNDINYFFDYGTALCPLSDRIRIRNGARYNHADSITKAASQLMPNADFYYDDVIHMGLDIPNLDREQVNFIVGFRDKYIARLKDEIIYYRLIRKENGDTVSLLLKEETTED